MFKKGQGLSISTIIIAILVLVVLVVLVLIFTGYFGGFSANVTSCTTQGGTCDSPTVCEANEGRSIGSGANFEECAEAEVCCVTL